MEEPKVRDYYEDLELPFGASRKDIMQAFRRLAKIYHPDKQGPGAAADGLEFQRIREAQESLCDDHKRYCYDLRYPNIQKQWSEYRQTTQAEQARQAEKERFRAHEAKRGEEERNAREAAEQEAKRAEDKRKSREAAEKEAKQREGEAMKAREEAEKVKGRMEKERMAEERSREAARRRRVEINRETKERVKSIRQREIEEREREVATRRRREMEEQAKERAESEDKLKEKVGKEVDIAVILRGVPLNYCGNSGVIFKRLPGNVRYVICGMLLWVIIGAISPL